MEKKNQKDQKKRAIYAAIAMLLVSAIVITSASFAWFSLGRSAQVENLDLKVTKEGEGIAISANASKFTSVLTYEDLKGSSSTDFKNYLQTEYNNIVKSVYLNEGFYVGRYETSGMSSSDDNVTVSIVKGKTISDGINNIEYSNYYTEAL